MACHNWKMTISHFKERAMKKILIGVYLSLVATMVWASCTTHTYMYNGKMVTCTTCCYGEGQFRSCSTTCI